MLKNYAEGKWKKCYNKRKKKQKVMSKNKKP